MFEDQLLEITRLKHEGELIEAANLACQLNASHQIDRHIDTVLAQVVQKPILYVLGVLGIVVHLPNRLSLFQFFLLVIKFKNPVDSTTKISSRITPILPETFFRCQYGMRIADSRWRIEKEFITLLLAKDPLRHPQSPRPRHRPFLALRFPASAAAH